MLLSQPKNRKVLSNSQLLNEYLEKQIRDFVIGMIEAMLELEIVELLCRRKYQRLKTTQSKRYYRNGYRKRYFLTLYCMLLQVRIPRCRGIRYNPILFRDKNILEPAMEQMLIQLWSDGNSYRDIQNFVKKVYGSGISLGFLSRMVGKIDEYVKQYHNRKLYYHYDSVYIDGMEICIKELPVRQRSDHCRSNKIGKNAVVLAVLGQRQENKKIIREIIDYRIARTENEYSYTELLRSLRNRGLSPDKITVVVHDGEDSIRLGIKNVYGKENIPEQECIFHKLVNLTKSVENKMNETLFKKELWYVYSSETKEEYEENKIKFIRKWKTEEPKAVRLFRVSDDRLTTKYNFDIEMHKSIHTNNPIERYFRELRRRIKAIGIFETISSADRLLFLMIESINQRRGSLPSVPNLKFTH